ncbi:MAG: hypothetical protein AAFY43_01725 [Pseudomonadota bacterium]
MELAAKAAPFVRIFLYLLTGWLASKGWDQEALELVRTDPAVLSAITGGGVAVWYLLAKWRGWST